MGRIPDPAITAPILVAMKSWICLQVALLKRIAGKSEVEGTRTMWRQEVQGGGGEGGEGEGGRGEGGGDGGEGEGGRGDGGRGEGGCSRPGVDWGQQELVLLLLLNMATRHTPVGELAGGTQSWLMVAQPVPLVPALRVMQISAPLLERPSGRSVRRRMVLPLGPSAGL